QTPRRRGCARDKTVRTGRRTPSRRSTCRDRRPGLSFRRNANVAHLLTAMRQHKKRADTNDISRSFCQANEWLSLKRTRKATEPKPVDIRVLWCEKILITLDARLLGRKVADERDPPHLSAIC